MKPPVLVIELDSGDVLLFDTPVEAAQAVEAYDVEMGEYKAFDADGRLLAFRVTPPVLPRRVRLLARFRIGAWALGPVDVVPTNALVELVDAEEVPTHCPELEDHLRRNLARKGLQPEDASIEMLIDLAKQHLKGG